MARAFLDVCFAVLDRWTSRQTERYGRLRDALRSLTLTVAVFYDKGVLGSRSPEFLRQAADPRVWAVGYERLAAKTGSTRCRRRRGSLRRTPPTRSGQLTRERGVLARFRPDLWTPGAHAPTASARKPALGVSWRPRATSPSSTRAENRLFHARWSHAQGSPGYVHRVVRLRAQRPRAQGLPACTHRSIRSLQGLNLAIRMSAPRVPLQAASDLGFEHGIIRPCGGSAGAWRGLSRRPCRLNHRQKARCRTPLSG